MRAAPRLAGGYEREQAEAVAHRENPLHPLERVGLTVVGVEVKAEVARPPAIADVLVASAPAAKENAPERVSPRHDDAEKMRLERIPPLEVRALVEPAPPTVRPVHSGDVVPVEQVEHRGKHGLVDIAMVDKLREVSGRSVGADCC